MRFADKTTIYIPSHIYTMDAHIRHWVQCITEAAGGVTIEEVRGGWKDNDLERVHRISWWHEAKLPAIVHTTTIARQMICEYDQEAVLVEMQRSGSFHHAALLTLADVEESDDD